MIFQKTLPQVLSGQKGQTRRLVQPGDIGIPLYDSHNVRRIEGHYFEVLRNGRLLYQVGKSYAAQPGRSQPAAGRIRLKSIRRERVNEISDADILAEGFPEDPSSYAAGFAGTWEDIHGLGSYTSGPEVWCLEFSLVEED